MKLKAIRKCWDHINQIAVPVGGEFELPEEQGRSLIQIGAAIAIAVTPAPLSNALLDEEAIAPLPPEPKPKPHYHRKPKTQSVGPG